MEVRMDVAVVQQPALRVAALRHTGPYYEIGSAFQKLSRIVSGSPPSKAGDAVLVAVYHDNPAKTKSADLRSDAGIVIAEGVPVPQGLTESESLTGLRSHLAHWLVQTVAGGVAAPEGMVAQEWAPAGSGPSYEKYLNTPETASENELRTEVYLPLK